MRIDRIKKSPLKKLLQRKLEKKINAKKLRNFESCRSKINKSPKTKGTQLFKEKNQKLMGVQKLKQPKMIKNEPKNMKKSSRKLTQESHRR